VCAAAFLSILVLAARPVAQAATGHPQLGAHLDAGQVHGVGAAADAGPHGVPSLQQLQADDADGGLAIRGIEVLRHSPDAVVRRVVPRQPVACRR